MNHQSEQNSPPQGKQQLSLRLSAELVEGAGDAVYWTPGLTLNELAEVALSHMLACMELLRGGRFLPRGPAEGGQANPLRRTALSIGGRRRRSHM